MSAQPSSKWICFYPAAQQKPKTRVYDVVKNEKPKGDELDFAADLHELGQVKWYGPWRCYAFFPADGTLFERVCLRDIAAFCDWLMAERKREKGNG